jgi:HAD superfamily hydrolase (TIGR01490 family)
LSASGRRDRKLLPGGNGLRRRSGVDAVAFRSRRSRNDSAVLAGAASAAAAEVESTPLVEPDLTAGAFFDVDNTMMMGASIYHFARGLASRDFFHSRDLLRFAWQQLTFRVGGSESAENMTTAREAALAFVAGREVSEIVRLGEEIYDEAMADRIWQGTRAMAQEHLDAGRRVWLVTATPYELASLIARRLGLTGALGTVSEVEDGRYTGRLVGEPLHGPAKAEAVRALAEREGLDLSSCYAYSDSTNDLPMLSLVGHPFAVNPDPDLRAAARANGWEIRDFRTARKAVKVGLPAAAGVGAVSGGIVAGVVLRRRHAGHSPGELLGDVLLRTGESVGELAGSVAGSVAGSAVTAAAAARRSFRNRPDLGDLRRAGAASRGTVASAARAAGSTGRAVLPRRSRPSRPSRPRLSQLVSR